MKKFLLFLLMFIIANTAFAENEVSFVYINGSNNNNPKMKNWFEHGIEKFHPVLRKKLLKNKDIKKYFPNYELKIKETPVIFFWGYKSHQDLSYVKSQLELSKAISSTGAYIVRDLLTQFLHDAIWVQKSHNMFQILDELNDKVKLEANKGNDVVLYGYSAGTFVTYEYLFNKLRYINVEELLTNLQADEDIQKFAKKNPVEDTCISALSSNHAGIGSVSMAGDILLNPNKNLLKQNLLKLNETTEAVCAPKGKVRGIVNYASPLVLFYSDLADTHYELNYYNKLLVKYIMENGLVMLTVNFREDPLGFPTSRNLTFNEMEDILDINLKNPSGFIYDNSSVWSKRMFPFAHTSYWKAKGTFSNAIVKSLVNGYKFNYDKEYQNKVIKRNRKKSEL